MIIKELPDVGNVLIRILQNKNIPANNRIIAIDLFKKIKGLENIIIQARQPLINKYAAKDEKTKKFKTISYKKNGMMNYDYIIPPESKALYDMEMKSLLEFDYPIEPVKLFIEEEINFLPKNDIQLLRKYALVVPMYEKNN